MEKFFGFVGPGRYSCRYYDARICAKFYSDWIVLSRPAERPKFPYVNNLTGVNGNAHFNIEFGFCSQFALAITRKRKTGTHGTQNGQPWETSTLVTMNQKRRNPPFVSSYIYFAHGCNAWWRSTTCRRCCRCSSPRVMAPQNALMRATPLSARSFTTRR